MSRPEIEAIKKRIAHLEPTPAPPLIWPPREGSLEYCIWQSMGSPMEPKRTFEEFYMIAAAECWKREAVASEED